MQPIKACLWYQSEAEEAANFYVSLFPNSSLGSAMRGAPGTPVIAIEFTLNGAPFLALNGRREKGFTDAHSYMILCQDQAEIDRYWNALTTNGGEEGQCGWLIDRFGVSWQVAPANFPALLGGPDAAASGRAMQAMMQMGKIDIATIERARDGVPA